MKKSNNLQQKRAGLHKSNNKSKKRKKRKRKLLSNKNQLNKNKSNKNQKNKKSNLVNKNSLANNVEEDIEDNKSNNIRRRCISQKELEIKKKMMMKKKSLKQIGSNMWMRMVSFMKLLIAEERMMQDMDTEVPITEDLEETEEEDITEVADTTSTVAEQRTSCQNKLKK